MAWEVESEEVLQGKKCVCTEEIKREERGVRGVRRGRGHLVIGKRKATMGLWSHETVLRAFHAKLLLSAQCNPLQL
jgi:hypothetical protein